MTTPEGQKAIEAALKAFMDSYDGPQQQMACAIRAYLEALPGWRLVPVEEIDEALSCAQMAGEQGEDCIRPNYSIWPSPPGLDQNSEASE